MEVRVQKHKLFLGVNGNVNRKDTVNPVITNKMFDTNYHYNQQEITIPGEIWPPNTVLLIGDSMLNQLDQDRLSTSTNKLVKVRSYGGAGINTLYTKLDGLLKNDLIT